MVISKEAFDFNKELLFGEVGALIGAQTFSYIASHLTDSVNLISYSTVLGAILAAALFWVSIRVYDEKKRKELSRKKFTEDLAYFTPVAFILTSIIYYPSLFFISRYFLEHKDKVVYSVFLSQLIAFSLFLIAINIYRHILLKWFGKKL